MNAAETSAIHISRLFRGQTVCSSSCVPCKDVMKIGSFRFVLTDVSSNGKPMMGLAHTTFAASPVQTSAVGLVLR